MTKHHMNFTRRETLKGFVGVSAIAMLPACRGNLPELAPDAMLDQIAHNLMAHEPERATGLGVDTGEYAEWRGMLSDVTPDGLAKYAATLETDLRAVRDYPKDGLTADQLTGFDVVESAYSTALEGFALPYGNVAVGSWRNTPYSVIQNVGSYIDMPRFMDSGQPLNDASDIDAYAARMEAFPAMLDGELARIQKARAMGLVPPDFLLDKAIRQMESSIESAAATYSAPLLRSELEGAEDAAANIAKLTEEKVVAALNRQLEELKAQRAVATSEAGMWSRPQGDEFYAWALKASTTTSMTPNEIHEEGLEQMAQIQARMDSLLRGLGYTRGSVGERMQALGDDPRYKFAEGDPGRQEIMAFIQERIDWIKAQMPRAFSNPVDPNMEVRRIPPAEEVGAPTAYGGAGSKDGSIPGRMWINLASTDLHRRFGLPSLIFHETIPGHVWEGEYSNRLPLIRSILAFGAFSEGWGLYAEQMAAELGAYEDHPEGELGYLQKTAWRAARLVTDTGMHHKRWSRERAIEYFSREVALPQAQIVSEVERYCSWPGQACSYLIGKLEILRQRERAQSSLGDTYDFKAFNDAVILGCNSPLDVLAKNVDRYIESASG
jgi:uncharacterized protein (DUF885 family)